jgi:hypothetical protein
MTPARIKARVKAASYLFNGDGIKASIDDYDDYWRASLMRVTTADSDEDIAIIEDTKWANAEFAISAIEAMIDRRKKP